LNFSLLCIRTDDHPASLEKPKVNDVLSDEDAGKHPQVRVTDESGKDYLYPKEYFVLDKLPKTTEQVQLNVV